MSYRFKPRRTIEREVRRIVDKQLALAVDRLRATGDPRSDEAVHEARRHIKKVRAVLRLVKPSLGDAYRRANRQLRIASRMLAPIADGEAVVGTVARLRRQGGDSTSARAISTIRAALIERSAAIDRRAQIDRVLPKVTALLRLQRRTAADWQLNAQGFRALRPGLRRGARRARKAMRLALDAPTAVHFHRWRRRVKDLWFQVRLVERRCGGRLGADERRLEALDGCLGEYHNLVLLEQTLIKRPCLPRREMARCLRQIRRRQAGLRSRAFAIGRGIFEEKPRQLVRRVHRLWRSAKASVKRRAEAPASWRAAA